MSNAIKVGVFAAVVLAMLAVLILRIEDLPLFAAETRTVDATFDSVAGLDDKASVRVAGVRVGRVDGVSLDGRQARVTLLLEQEVPLTEGSRAVIASVGLLGDKYIELVPGPPGAPPLPEGAVLPGETPASLEQAIARFDSIGQNIERLTGSLAGGQGEDNQISRLLTNLEEVSGQVRDLLAANREEVDATVANFEQVSATLARELPRLADKMEGVLSEVGAVVAENRGDLSESMDNIRRVTARLEPAVEDLNTITDRLARGEGTIGKLLTSDEAHDQLVGTLSSIESGVGDLGETLGAVRRIGLGFGVEGFYLEDSEEGQAALSIDIDTSSEWLYRVAAVNSAFGEEETRTQRITTTEADGTTSTQVVETVTREDDIVFDALLGRQFGELRLWTGLKESTFGVQAEYPLFDDKLWLSLEAFDFDRDLELDPHLRFATRWRLHPNLYLLGGFDDLLESERDSIFFGAGVSWQDEDLKYLLGAAPVP